MTMLSPPHECSMTLSERGPEVTYTNLTSGNFWIQQSSSKYCRWHPREKCCNRMTLSIGKNMYLYALDAKK